MPNEAEETGDFILFMDELFDSLNGNSKTAALSKALKGGISRSSGHKDFWQNSIKILSSITFFDAKNKKHVKVPSIVNLVKTLRGFLILREKLLTRMSYILPRAMNQDCLENFFSSLRGHTRFVMYPDVAHFITSFKALLVNNFFSTHSPGANCEEDFSSGVLDNLRTFLTGEEMAGVTPIDASEIDMEVNIEDLPVGGRKSRVARATLAYIAGYVAKKMLKKFGNCDECKRLLLHSDGDIPVEVIQAKTYRKSSLVEPGGYLYFVVTESCSRLFYCIPRLCHIYNISGTLEAMLFKYINFSVLNCSIHTNLGKLVCELIVCTITFFWTKQVNLILKGNNEKFKCVLTNLPHSKLIDPIRVEAHNKYLKRRKTAKKH